MGAIRSTPQVFLWPMRRLAIAHSVRNELAQPGLEKVIARHPTPGPLRQEAVTQYWRQAGVNPLGGMVYALSLMFVGLVSGATTLGLYLVMWNVIREAPIAGGDAIALMAAGRWDWLGAGLVLAAGAATWRFYASGDPIGKGAIIGFMLAILIDFLILAFVPFAIVVVIWAGHLTTLVLKIPLDLRARRLEQELKTA